MAKAHSWLALSKLASLLLSRKSPDPAVIHALVVMLVPLFWSTLISVFSVVAPFEV